MNRRSLLALLGIAPAAIALPAIGARHTHPIVYVPAVQCGKCAAAMRWVGGNSIQKLQSIFRSRAAVPVVCDQCGVTALVAPLYTQGEVIAAQET